MGKQKVQHALPSGSLQRDNVELLTMALFQILVSCLARQHTELFSADAESDPERPRTMTQIVSR